MAANLSLVQYQNVCGIQKHGKKCGYRFDNMPLRVPIIGEPPEERAGKILEKMAMHIIGSHPDMMASIKMEAERVYAVFRIAGQFEIQDPNAIQHLKILRAQIVIAAGKPFIPDAHIQERIAAAGPLTPESVFALMSTMRDILCEIGPSKPASLVVSP